MKYEIPIKDKLNLTIEEAAAYSGVGQNKIRQLTNEEDCKFVLFVGNKKLIKREEFEKFLKRSLSI